jgi:phenylalanyl-tRNA synthetase beta chain
MEKRDGGNSMIISINWLKEHVAIDMPIDDLATLIGARLVEIEAVIDYGAKYKDVLVAKVVSCEKLEDSDHLSVTKLDDGGAAKDVERDDDGYVQVVCGAPNIRVGLLVAWLPPQSTVPETFDTAEPFVLDARKIRGVMSNGMIASARELALFDEHVGILEIGTDAKPGTSFAELLQLDDTLLDIENKSLTHRPDAFGVVGFAREIAGIQGKQFVTPDWLAKTEPDYPEKMQSEIAQPRVTIDDPELSDRYQGVVIANVDGSTKTPLPLQSYLARVGMRPISAIVDTTNYLMLETGQPLHAFDYDKLAAINNGVVDIHVRAGRESETLELLDGRTITLSSDDIVIANGETAVALAGAMGGAATEVDEQTKTIFLESATFNLYNLRATQMRHGIFSEAITRFTKGQPAALIAPVLAKALQLTNDFMDGERVSDVVEAYPGKYGIQPIELTARQVNAILGSHLTVAEIVSTLRNVGFAVEDGEILKVTAPYWRSDIHIVEDLVEEVGRLNGFDSITPILPGRDFTAVAPSEFDLLRARIRNTLTRSGANEVLTYSFVHGDTLEKAGQKRQDSYRITNSISPDLQYYRQTLTPSLLQHIHSNIKQGFDAFALFELNKTHPKPHGLTDEGVPNEIDMLALTIAHKKHQKRAPYYEAKKVLDYLGESLGLSLSYAPIREDSAYPVTAPFELRRSAFVTDAKSGTFIGTVGEYKKNVMRHFKLPEYSAGFEIETPGLLEAVQKLENDYKPLSRYPGTERDVCFRVASDITYGEIIELVRAVLVETEYSFALQPVDIYQAPDNTATKNITIRIQLTPYDRTLTGDEATTVINAVVERVIAETDAELV